MTWLNRLRCFFGFHYGFVRYNLEWEAVCFYCAKCGREFP
jgi:hypothetical protein